jgi:hypothetical protein
MMTKRKGTTLVEWVVAGVIAIAIVGAIAYSIMTSAAVQGGNAKNWVDSISVPASAH